MKATALLDKQHIKVQRLLARLERGRGAPAPILTELANDLAAHMAIEQDLFYPAAREAAPELVLESYEEHAISELALKRLLATDPDDPSFKARVTAVKTLLDRHIAQEKKILFPRVEKALGSKRLLELGRLMKARFDGMVSAGFEALVPAGFKETSADGSLHSVH